MHGTQHWGSGRLVELDEQTCRGLLQAAPVGRLVWCGPEGPAVVPVNFVVHDDAVWIRSTPYSALARESVGSKVAFEVDAFDEGEHTGWSVVVRGRARWHAPDQLPPDLPGLSTWPAGPRPFVLAVTLDEVTGRRVHGA